MSSSRCLRIGVVLGDRLVEERTFTAATPVTLGQSIKCALSVPVDGVPKEHVLFGVDQGRHVLRLVAGMEGRLAAKGGAIEALSGPAEIAIASGARGKLRIGEATILFQEMARPAVAPKPQLPASVRGTLADRIDRRLAMIIGGSLIVHVAIALWAWQGDVEHELLGTPEPRSQYAVATMDVTLPDTIDLTPAPQPGAAIPAAPAHPIVRPIHVATPAPHAPTNDDAARLASILASSDDGAHGPAGMSRRQPGADLDKQLAEVRGRRITIGDGEHTSRADDRARIGTIPDSLPINDPTLTRLPDKDRAAEIHDRFTLDRPRTDEPTSLTPDNVMARIIGLYLKGLERCYSRSLATDPSLTGKIAIAFTIDERGHVTDASAAGMEGQITACVESQMATWRFAIPKDKHGDPTEAPFKVGLILR
jgi:hypothetical protein